MRRYEGPLVSTKPNLYGECISEQVIKSILENGNFVPVTVNYGGAIVGQTTGYYLDDDTIICKLELNESAFLPDDHTYLSPTFENVELLLRGRIKEIVSGSLVEVSISSLPVEPSMRAIKPF